MKFLSLLLEGIQTILCWSELMGSSDPQGTSFVLSRGLLPSPLYGLFPLSASKLQSPSLSPAEPCLPSPKLQKLQVQLTFLLLWPGKPLATSGPAQSFPARKGWCPAFEHCCFISVRFCWSNYSIMIVWPAHILCASVHTACLLLKVNRCLRKSTCKVQRVVAKEIHQTVFKMHSKGPWADTAMVTQMSSDRHFLEKPWSVPVILVKTNNLHCHWEILHFYGEKEFLEETHAS